MSMMATVKTQIRDLELFKEICEAEGLGTVKLYGYDQNGVGDVLDLTGSHERVVACVSRLKNDTYALTFDQDNRYSPKLKTSKTFLETYGSNAGRLLQKYGEAVLRKQMIKTGGTLVGRTVRADGSIVLAYTVK